MEEYSEPTTKVPAQGPWLRYLDLAVSLLAAVLFQMFSLAALIPLLFFVMFSPGTPFWEAAVHSSQPEVRIRLALLYLIPGALYAAAWLGGWTLLSKMGQGRIRHFYVHVLFAMLPLILIALQLEPSYNPDAMIPSSEGELTCLVSAVWSAVILFPLYSAGIRRFVLYAPPRKALRYIAVCAVCIPLGLAAFALLWHMAPALYEGLRGFPD